jgi:putative flippase GtrA
MTLFIAISIVIAILNYFIIRQLFVLEAEEDMPFIVALLFIFVPAVNMIGTLICGCMLLCVYARDNNICDKFFFIKREDAKK